MVLRRLTCTVSKIFCHASHHNHNDEQDEGIVGCPPRLFSSYSSWAACCTVFWHSMLWGDPRQESFVSPNTCLCQIFDQISLLPNSGCTLHTYNIHPLLVDFRWYRGPWLSCLPSSSDTVHKYGTMQSDSRLLLFPIASQSACSPF